MNRKFIVLCVTALLVSGLSGQFLSGNTGAILKEIRTLEDTMNDAYARNDLPRYFSYYATDFVQWLPEGRTDLAKYERDWTDYIAAGNKVQAIEIRQMIVKVDAAEDTAVASYILYVKTKLADGKITEEENQETDIWFKRNGNWKIVALHYSPAAKK